MKLVSTIKAVAPALFVFHCLRTMGEVELERRRLARKLANSEARHRVLENTLIYTTRHLAKEDAMKLRDHYRSELEFERIAYNFNK